MCGPSTAPRLDVTREEIIEQRRIFDEKNPGDSTGGEDGNSGRRVVGFSQHLYKYVQDRDAARAKARDPKEIEAKATAKSSAERISRRRRMQTSSLLASGAEGDTNLITGEAYTKPVLGA